MSLQLRPSSLADFFLFVCRFLLPCFHRWILPFLCESSSATAIALIFKLLETDLEYSEVDTIIGLGHIKNIQIKEQRGQC